MFHLDQMRNEPKRSTNYLLSQNRALRHPPCHGSRWKRNTETTGPCTLSLEASKPGNSTARLAPEETSPVFQGAEPSQWNSLFHMGSFRLSIRSIFFPCCLHFFLLPIQMPEDLGTFARLVNAMAHTFLNDTLKINARNSIRCNRLRCESCRCMKVYLLVWFEQYSAQLTIWCSVLIQTNLIVLWWIIAQHIWFQSTCIT